MAQKKKRASAPTPVAAPAPPAPLARPSRPPRWGIGLLVAASAVSIWFARARGPVRPNVLLVTVATLRADHVGVYGDAAARTPVLDALAQRGVRFARAQAAVPLTGPSHSTILTGLYPPVHGVRDNVIFPLSPRHPTLATLLKKLGYR